MIDLAISDDVNRKGDTIALTNHGRRIAAPNWPQDSDFQLVSFTPSGKECYVEVTGWLANDIGMALKTIDDAGLLPGRKPDWYRTLARCAKGASSV